MKKQDFDVEKNESLIDITLVGEDHRDCSHLLEVLALMKDKLLDHEKIILALEQKFSKDTPYIKFPLDTQQKTREGGRVRRTTVPLERQAIDRLGIQHQGLGEYNQMLLDIEKYAKEKKKEVIVIGADTLGIIKDFTSVRRDKAMYKKIKDIIVEHDINVVIFPVGSNHIAYGKGTKRLASLFKDDVTIDLKIKNFYNPKGKILGPGETLNAYDLVKLNISNFESRYGLNDNIDRTPIPEKVQVVEEGQKIKLYDFVRRKRLRGTTKEGEKDEKYSKEKKAPPISITGRVKKLSDMSSEQLAETISTRKKDGSDTIVKILSPNNTPPHLNRPLSKSL